MLIRDRRMMSTAVRRTALRGTSSEGSTLAIQSEKGRPSSRANWNKGQYLFDVVMKIVTHGPHLP